MTEHSERTTGAADNRQFRAVVPGVDPDAAYQAMRQAGGFRSWEDPTRDLHCLGPNRVEVYRAGGLWVLTVNGPSVEAVRDGVRLLRCGADRDVHELKGAV
ncbi:hypothetical protein [Saccharopolyspora sp. SCSIO 74807]|uniref:hypothetical protein n=1 Tax=Saccharopolyspora sp. SCSIO 74807 TaxID=3118084 RepID=UPI0030D04E04